MNDTTARRRGRHAAPRPSRPPVPVQATAVVDPAPPPGRRFEPFHLPGMELLGFYDEPYRVVSVPKRRPVLPARQLLTVPPRVPGTHSSSTAMVADLWETTELDSEALEWWKPGVIARRKLGGRKIRTATVVASMLLAAIVGALLWFVTKRPAQIDSQARANFVAASSAANGAMKPLTGLARSLGADQPPDLVSSTGTILSAESAARALFAAAGDLPSNEANDAVKENAVGASGTILDATTALSKLVAFRLTAERVLSPPILPSEPEATDLADATEQVAAWRADVDSGINELPSGVLTELFSRLGSWQASLQKWQETYLDAVRQGDAAATRSAVDDQTARIEGLRQDMTNELSRRGAEIADGLEQESALIGGWSITG